ncbi:hypothetical protein [Actinacidiphila sp. ITFR-21]|uniref:hypothetical protein n=1 Tax=Actinacidiphila sp. ITFR-21 TaxID=3075199 RepID=UPI0028899558|nr:hypothetical protein [Streptomyces sp. ITFR-21]WNI15566.1 hypothetical protein RLT57_08520 [Streptomyces sp. ITFR-21]
MDRADAAALRAAITALPARCRYHGDNTEPSESLIHREACCDTGIPAQRRKHAEAILARLAGEVRV